MNTKRANSIFSLLLLIFLAINGCEDTINFDNTLPTPPAGMGSFSLKLSDASRTILPDTPGLSDFAVYNLNFTPTSGGEAVNADRTNATLATDPIFLEYGTYSLVVNAYKDNAKNQLMARGTLDGIVINPGKNTSAVVTLKTLLSGGAGTFKWTITFPEGVTAAMTITPGNAGGTDQETVPLASSASGSRALNSGPYNLTFNLEKPDREPVVWYELLYVYQNLESDFTFTFTDDYFIDTVYAVTYHYNDGITSNQSQSVLHGATLTAPTTPSKNGYAFAGWYTDNGIFANVWNFNNAAIESFDLYAKWVELSFELTVEMWDSYGDGWNASLKISVNGTYRPTNATMLYADARGPAYYRFAVKLGDVVRFYWLRNNSTAYNNQCAFAVYYSSNPPSPAFSPTDGAVVDTARILLYRQYNSMGSFPNDTEVGSITVSGNASVEPAVIFDANGGSGEVPSPIAVTDGSSVTLPNEGGLTKDGYVFGGWNTAANGTGTDRYPGASYVPTATNTLYARWDIPLTENFWTDGSIASIATGSSVWYSFNVASGTTYYVWWNDSVTGNATKTLDIKASAVYSDGSSIFTDIDSAWTTPRSFTANKNSTVHVKVAPNTNARTGTFAVVYSADSAKPTFYTVTFNINSGTGTLPSSPITVQPAGSGTILPDGDGLTRSGYVFGGWNIKNDGTGDNYSVGDSFVPTADTILYARWIPLRTVTFDRNSGTGTVPSPITVPDGSSITLPDGSGLTRNGYTYGGWFTSVSGTTTNYSVGASYTPTANVTLYARWITNYTVTFNVNEGTGTTPASITVPSGTSIILPNGSGLSKSGYVFGGWSSNNNGTGNPSYTSFTVSGNVTLNARWNLLLTEKIWTDGNITSMASGIALWYSINVTSGKTYYVSWNDGKQGDYKKTLDVKVSAFYGDNGFSINAFTDIDSAWTTPRSFTADRDGTVHLKVAPFNSYSGVITGTFAIKYDADHTVTFDANGGSGTAPSVQNVPDGVSITLPGGSGLTKDGYVFGGWNVNADGTGTDLYPGVSYKPTISATLYARWDIPLTENRWDDGSITSTASGSNVWYSFNVVGGATYYVWWNDQKLGNSFKTLDVAVNAVYSDGSSIFTEIDSAWTTPRSFTADRSGAVHVRVAPFNGGGAGTFAVAYSAGSARPTFYTVAFGSNGGSGTVPGQITVQPAGSSATLPGGNGLTRSGYVFGGWNANTDGTGDNYSVGDSFVPTADTTLYARWIPLRTVTFDRNGGTGTAPSPITAPEGSSITIPGRNTMTRSGYVFGGWNANTAGTGTHFYSDASYTVTADATLNARWDTLLNENRWVDGAYSVTSGAVWYAFNVVSGTTYYVWWNDREDGNSAKTLDVRASAVYSDGSDIFTIIDSGWTYPQQFTADRSGTVHVRVTLNPSSSVSTGTFAVVYSTGSARPAAYTVKYDNNNGNGAVPSQTVQPGSSITLSNGSGVSKNDHLFGGWNTRADGTGTDYNVGSSFTPTADITLYAKWNPSYTVWFNLNGGDGTTPPTSQTVVVGSSITLPPGVSKSGYNFAGWNTRSSGTEGTNYNAGASYTPTANITLFARWTSTVTFNANSGTVPAPQTVAVNTSITLPDTSRSGYTFAGWYASPSFSGTGYSVGASYTPTGNITLYAKWTCVVTYHANYKTISGTLPSPQTVTAGSSIILPGRLYNDTNEYVFDGWNTSTNGNGSNYSAGASFTPNGNITLYAKWLNYTVTFNINGASGTTPSSQSALPGQTIRLPYLDGINRPSTYDMFQSWNTKENGMGDNYDAGFSYLVTGNITLYAKWRRFLSENTWFIGDTNVTSGYNSTWYWFQGTAGTTYNIWWSDSKQGGGTSNNRTADIEVTVYNDSDGTILENVTDSGYYTPLKITPTSSGRITVKVERLTGNNGTYGIVFSTSNTRPSQ